MQVILWRVGRRNIVPHVSGIILTVFLTHLCCILPAVIMPLGLGSIGYSISKYQGELKHWLFLVPIFVLAANGIRTYRKQDLHVMDKIIYWFSVVLVIAIIFFSW